jgi:hypothetical protein
MYKYEYKEVSYIENMPELDTEKQASFLLELNDRDNRMRIYNGETKRIVFDLIKVSTDFYDKYIRFIETNRVPKDLVIPKELLEGWPGDIKISPLYSQDRKISYQAAAGISLFSMPDTGSQVVTNVPKGGGITPLEPGLTLRENGVTAPWVWAQTEDGAEGWCFSGYLLPEDIPEEAGEASSFTDITQSYKATANLRLRGLPATGGAIVTTIPAGGRVKVLRAGAFATIDGISAPWVYAITGEGRRGWCFSGYLEETDQEPEAPPMPAPPVRAEPLVAIKEAAPAEPATASGSGGIPPAAFIGGGIGIAALAALLVVMCRKKKA